MNYIEVIVQTDLDSGELLAMLDAESLGAWESDGAVHVFWPENEWSPGAFEELKKSLRQAGIADPDGILTVRPVPDRDWNAVWAASLKPIRLGRRILIRQSWNRSDPAFDGIELVIDPKRAFGTGYHATTQLVVEWLEHHIHGGERVLDVGTGSGILGMAAIRLGAASAVGIDNDPVAVECAREYQDGNGFGSELDLRVCSFEDLESGSFDLVLANLDIRTMPGFIRRLPDLLKGGGAACLSGLQPQDLEEVAEALKMAGYRIEAQTARDEWLCLQIA
jgi:ribosomal protein L11 methyltransferase